MDEFYAFDPFDGCHKKFSTAEAAKAEAEACIEYGRDRDHWPEEVDQIEWGMLVPMGRAQQVNRIEAADDDTGRCARDDLAYLCDYRLTAESNPLADAIRERDEARADLARLRAEHATALATARREGAEGMQQRCEETCASIASAHAERFVLKTAGGAIYAAREYGAAKCGAECVDAIRALPLDAPGGGS